MDVLHEIFAGILVELDDELQPRRHGWCWRSSTTIQHLGQTLKIRGWSMMGILILSHSSLLQRTLEYKCR
ncbi:hypothetical protein Pmani_019650 [Petrolisthes manimaculis]|uniref:Uncharacterized protein n=1 Tax=Petrolisthes manimaculis TaxID=1843537 RepID=A0AAE1PIG5_9EUCA|nr:hypothetical protein Pmani_019650 [Petrolisthes manimaculis]